MDYRNDMRRGGVFPGGQRAVNAAPGKIVKMRRSAVPQSVQGAIDTLPKAMVYSPMQKFEGIKDIVCALEAGTIFDALDLPFKGGRRR